jgi:type IV secretory pathway TraG/TraD family ATPase VirD4
MLRHPDELLIALSALLAVALIVRVVAGNPNGHRLRARGLRWRIRLYLRPGPGYANLLELLVRWSRLRAVLAAGRARPGLPWWARLVLPVTQYGVRVGRAHLGRRVIASMEDQCLVLAAPRTGKSGWLADRIIDHPGAVICTSTRTDLFDNTAALRSRHGVVHVFNPEGIGGLLSTFRWNPLRDCDQPAAALQRATALAAATETEGMQDLAFWIGKAASVLACLMHAAALGGHAMTDVYEWAHGIGDSVPERILATHPDAAPGWTGPIREFRRPGRTADSIRITVTRALAWLADPAVAEATSPGLGEGFDVAEFAAGHGTLYMIGTGREDAPIAPLFRAFAEYAHAGAAMAGSLQPHGRLDPPMLMTLDEVTQICPVPLPQWMADSAGKGIMIIAVCHGLAQLEDRWGEAGAQAIWDTAGLKVIQGGVTDTDTLETLSLLCGHAELRRRSWSRDEYGRRARTVSYESARVAPPELIRMLPDRRALVVRGNLSPVVVKLRMVWKRRDYARARRLGVTPYQPVMVRAGRSADPFDTEELDAIGGEYGDWLIGDGIEGSPGQPDDAGTGGLEGPADPQGPAAPTSLPPPRPRRPWDPPGGGGQ